MRGHEFKETNSNSNFDRCVSSLENYLPKKGSPKDYDPRTRFFSSPSDSANFDAHVRVITVADRDASVPEFDEPTMYDAAFFTKSGSEKSGMLALLAEEQFDTGKQVRYEFQSDRNVRRLVIQEGNIETDEFLQPDEVGFMADQLETIGSASSH